MISLYNPATGTFVAASGGQQSDPLLMVNILIELRVANRMAQDMQRGVVTQTLAQYRSDVMNETVNASI